MNMKLTNHFDANKSILVLPIGGEPFKNLEINRLAVNLADREACFGSGPIHPAGIHTESDIFIIAIHLDQDKNLSLEWLRRTYGDLIRSISSGYYRDITVVIPKISGLTSIGIMESITEGIQLGSYTFLKYKSGSDAHAASIDPDCTVSLYLDEDSISDTYYDALFRISVISDGVMLARDLINEPGNHLFPQAFIDRIMEETCHTGISIDVYDEKVLKEKNMTGILSVGKGSQRPPRLCILKHLPDTALPVIVLIGKGVTTDLGGMNLKIGDDLAAAKTDMGGAAVVVSVLKIAALLGIRCNIYGIIPIVENICDGGALKPGEILTYNNGITVEIRNSDAEGRLILADGLLIARGLHPDAIIDIATLTGSCIRALGSKIAGILGSDELVEQIIQSGLSCGEHFWKLPLFEEYSAELASDVADISNLALEEPGVITAALFLKRFAGDENWAHLDIAGTRNAKSTSGHIIKGGTGFGVKTMTDFIEKAAFAAKFANNAG